MKKQCQQYEEWDDEYEQMFELKSIKGLQPDGFLVRFPFYVLAGRDAQIVFAETENPDFFTDNVYEIGEYWLLIMPWEQELDVYKWNYIQL